MITIYDIIQNLLYLTDKRYALFETENIIFLGLKIWNFDPDKCKEET